MENTETITHKFYETMAEEFSSTRYKPWPKIKQFLQNHNGLLLDAGCGNGRNMPPNSIGIDFSRGLLQQACIKNPQNEFIEANILELPFIDSVFDNVMSVAVIHHLNSHERRIRAMDEMHRVLKKGGMLLIYVWDKKAIKSGKFIDIGNDDYMVDWKNSGCMRYYHMYDLDTFTCFLKSTKFEVVELGTEQESLFALLKK